jgi:prevent-host-death family protein
MSGCQVGVDEFAANAAEYVRRTEDEGASFTLTRAGQPVAVLAPVHRGMRIEDLPRLVAALPRLGDEEAEAFAADVLSARAALPGEPPRDAWLR